MGGITPAPAAGGAFTMYYAYGAIGTAPSIGFYDRGNIPGVKQFTIKGNGAGNVSINFNGLDALLGWLQYDLFLMPHDTGLGTTDCTFQSTAPAAGDQYGIQMYQAGAAQLFSSSFWFLARVNPPL